MILEKVKTIIADTLNCEESEITLTSNITEDFGADSLEMVELAMALEDAFGIAIAEEEYASLRTVEDIVDFIESKSEATGRAAALSAADLVLSLEL